MHLYYDIIAVAAIGDAHHIEIILNVPLKRANRHFVWYKILALPTRLFNEKFVQYLAEFLFFGIHTVQHNHILFTEAELCHCTHSSIFSELPRGKECNALKNTHIFRSVCGPTLYSPL